MEGGVPVRLHARRSARRRGRTTLPGWRWRRNPLRRGTDVAEAWLLLATSALLFLTPFAGWWAGHAVDRALQRVVRTERAQRTLVTATVVPASGKAGSAPQLTRATAERRAESGRLRDDVLRWTTPDHTVHTAAVPGDAEVRRGDSIRVWTDRHGRLVPPPLDSATATTHAVLAGASAAAAAAGLLLISRQILLWRMLVARLASWEREWARVGGNWGRTGAEG